MGRNDQTGERLEESTAGLRWQAGGRVGPSPTHRGSSSSQPDLRCVRAFFYFMDRSRTKVLSQHFCDFILVCTHGGLVLLPPSLYVQLLKGIHNARRNVTAFQTQRISGTSRHPSTTVSRRRFLTLAFRRKYSLKVTTLRLHGLPCPWIYFSCIPDLGYRQIGTERAA